MRVMLFLIAIILYMVDMQAQDPPLIDRALFFGNPEISGSQLSPDGKYLSFMKAYEGIMNIWIKKAGDPFDKAIPLTDSKRPMYGYFWSDDSKYILYVKDQEGDENINVYAVQPDITKLGLPESINLTPLKEVAAQLYHTSQNNPDIIMVGLNDRDKAWHDLYELKISTATLTLKYENTSRITGYNFDWDDRLRILYRTDEKGNTTMLRIDKDNTLTPIYTTSVTENASIVGWNEDNSKFYLITNVGNLDKLTLYLMDPATMKMTMIESDPEGKVDFGSLIIDRNTRKIIGTSYTLDKDKYYWKDKKWESAYNDLRHKLPGRELVFQSSTKDYSKQLIASHGDKYVAEIYLYDRKSKNLTFQYAGRPKLKNLETSLSGMTPIHYKSSDGLDIPAYLTIPAGKEAKALPLVVLVHGGPKGPRDYWGYDPEVQFLANRGYAVLQPNFRASGGYGKQFLNAGDLQWGKLMQDDITYGVKHLIEKGIAHPSKIGIMGGSYGGYATLAGLAFTPELYTCGVDIVGPSNIFTLLESVPAYWESGRSFLYGMVGDPATEEGKKRIYDASPLFSVDKIVKPLLIIQGANDPRVKQAEADQIVIALRDKGKKVDYLLAKDEGHGFAKPLNKMAMYAAVEQFLSEILGGRYQKDMPDDVRSTLETLTVDINKVTYQPKGALTISGKLPKTHIIWREGVTNYSTKIEVAGQVIHMEIIRTITKEGNNWKVREESKGAMGDASDEVIYQADGVPVSRTIMQMGQDILFTFGDKQASVTLQGQNMDIPLEGAYMADGPGTDLIISGFDLKSGFNCAYAIPDMITMKAKNTILSVKEDDIHYIAEVVNNDNEMDKTVYFVRKDTKVTDKIVQTIPAMQYAIMTTTRK